MRRLTHLASALWSTTAALALLVGVPWALITFVGNPLPGSLPSRDVVSWYLQNGQIPDAVWIGFFACILWVVWAQIVVAFVTELVAAIRGISTPELPGLGIAQALVGPVVARAAMVVSVLAATPGVASAATAPAMALPDIAFATDRISSTVSDATAAVSSFARAGSTAEVTVEAATGTVVVGERSSPRTEVEVARRDTLRSLAQTHLGDRSRWVEIRDVNVGRTMTDGTLFDSGTVIIRSGWSLLLPTNATPTETDPAPIEVLAADAAVDESMVEVVKDDHFWALAEATLTEAWGRAPTDKELTPYWAQFVEANVDLLLPPDDPNLIYPGQRFIVPPPPANPDLGPSAALSADEQLSERVAADVDVELPELDVPTQAPESVQEEPSPVQAPAPAEATTPTSRSAVPVDGLMSQNARTAALATVGAFTLALLSITANRLRRRRLDRRSLAKPGVIDTPQTLAVEDQIRALANDTEEAANYVTALNPWLSHILAPSGVVPAIVAVKAGSNGLEVLLDEPASLGDKFVSLNDTATAWRLTSDVTDRQMTIDAAGAFPYCPMLLPVGDSPSGPLLVDLEQLGAVGVTGDPATRDALLRRIVIAAMCSPWFTDRVELVAIGVPGIHPTPSSPIVVPADPATWAEQVAAETRRDAEAAHRSPYEDRIDGIVSDGKARLVVVGSGYAAVAQHLAPVAALAWSQLALVTATEISSEHSIVTEPGHGTLEPVSLKFDIEPVDDSDFEVVDQLLATALPEPDHGHTPEPTAPPEEPVDDVIPSDRCLERIAQINTPKGIELQILSEVPNVKGADLTDKPTAVLAFIALHPGIPAAKVRSEFWKENERAAQNQFTWLRRDLGQTADAVNRLPKAANMRLNDVGCDWDRFTAFVEAADSAEAAADASAFLDAALALVEGYPARRANPVLWRWFTEAGRWYAEVERVVVDAASRRAGIAFASGDALAARHAIRQGLKITPESEALLMLSMQATKMIEGDAELHAQFAAAIEDAEVHGYDLTPEVHRFYRVLVNNKPPVFTAIGGGLPANTSNPKPASPAPDTSGVNELGEEAS